MMLMTLKHFWELIQKSWLMIWNILFLIKLSRENIYFRFRGRLKGWEKKFSRILYIITNKINIKKYEWQSFVLCISCCPSHICRNSVLSLKDDSILLLLVTRWINQSFVTKQEIVLATLFFFYFISFHYAVTIDMRPIYYLVSKENCFYF